jgi:hypothetical protein
LEEINFGGECDARIRLKGVIENWKEFIDGNGDVFEQCEGAETDFGGMFLGRIAWLWNI